MDTIKAIVPAAGLGTRFLPFTKSLPKEMLPLLNKPAFQWIIEEGIASDVSLFACIINKDKHSLVNHFDSVTSDMLSSNKELHTRLAEIEKIIRTAEFAYIRQSEPLGLGHAVWLARHLIGKEYVAIMLPDDLIINQQQPALAQLLRIARQERASVIAVQEVPLASVSSYGIIDVRKQINPSLFQVGSIIEKPSQKDTPSQLAVVGRYVLSHKIFSSLTQISSYASTELQLTDGICHMIRNQNEKVFAYKVQGARYDIGTPLGWIKAVIATSLQDPEYGREIHAFMQHLATYEPSLMSHHATQPSPTP